MGEGSVQVLLPQPFLGAFLASTFYLDQSSSGAFVQKPLSFFLSQLCGLIRAFYRRRRICFTKDLYSLTTVCHFHNHRTAIPLACINEYEM